MPCTVAGTPPPGPPRFSPSVLRLTVPALHSGRHPSTTIFIMLRLTVHTLHNGRSPSFWSSGSTPVGDELLLDPFPPRRRPEVSSIGPQSSPEPIWNNPNRKFVLGFYPRSGSRGPRRRLPGPPAAVSLPSNPLFLGGMKFV